MTKKHHEQKAWVPLVDADTDTRPFDQTNGAVDFDEGTQRNDEHPERDMLERGVAMNAIGFGGGMGG